MQVQPTVIYSEPGIYAGWPANHGAWQWGSEWLVGFLRGKYIQKSMHNIAEPFDYCFARSMDNGKTWSVESHQREFEAGVVVHPAHEFDWSNDNDIIRCCGVYDHGGDETDPCGGYFVSNDRGLNWHGPYKFTGLENVFDAEHNNTSRQCWLPQHKLVFLSVAERFHWGTDKVFTATMDAGKWSIVSEMDFGPGRAVMPAVAEVPVDGSDRIVVAVRRRMAKKHEGWVDSCYSDDGGVTWQGYTNVGMTGSHNGNPPALCTIGGYVYCAVVNRDTRQLTVYKGTGESWRTVFVKLVGDVTDIGYPRMFVRNRRPVVVLYAATRSHMHQAIFAHDCHVER